MFCCTRFCHLFDHVANEIVIVSLVDGYIECLVVPVFDVFVGCGCGGLCECLPWWCGLSGA